MRVLAAAALALLVIEAGPAVAAPPAAPAVRMPLLKGGETFDSRALIGKKVLVLRFQASWCKTCAAQAAGLQRVVDRYKGREVEIAMPGRFDISPAQKGAIATVPGVLEVLDI